MGFFQLMDHNIMLLQYYAATAYAIDIIHEHVYVTEF